MKYLNTFLIAAVAIIITSCGSAKIGSSSPFNIDDAKYTLYKGKEGNKGLFEFSLANLEDGLTVESIVFNRMLVPVTEQSTDNKGNVLVTAKINIPEEGSSENFIDKSNRINYT